MPSAEGEEVLINQKISDFFSETPVSSSCPDEEVDTSSSTALPTVRQPTLEDWDYKTTVSQWVSAYAYYSVWVTSCNLFDGLDTITRMKRKLKERARGAVGGSTSN